MFLQWSTHEASDTELTPARNAFADADACMQACARAVPLGLSAGGGCTALALHMYPSLLWGVVVVVVVVVVNWLRLD